MFVSFHLKNYQKKLPSKKREVQIINYEKNYLRRPNLAINSR